MSDKQKRKAIISDMDGVLVDSFNNFYLAYKQIMNENGVNGFTEDYYRRYFGARGDVTKKNIEADFNVNLGDVKSFLKRKDELYLQNAMKSTTPFNQTVTALKTLSKKYDVAVASSSYRRVLTHTLKEIGLDTHTKTWVSGDMVERGKPKPDIFIKAMEELKVDPMDCLVIEDSIPGMTASHGAGIRCICLLSDSADPSLYDKAHKVFKIREITSDILISEIESILN